MVFINLQLAGRGRGWRGLGLGLLCVCVCMLTINLQLAGRGRGWRGLGLGLLCVYAVYQPATRGPWTGLERVRVRSTVCVCVYGVYEPATRGPWTGLERTMPVSVIPYLSSNRCPVICSHRSITGWGSADEPLTISLQERKEMFI